MVRVSVTLREAWRTSINHPWRLLVGSTVVAVLVAGCGVLEVDATTRALTVMSDEASRGVNVLVVEDEKGPLNGTICESLNRQNGIVAAGGVTAPKVVSIGEPQLLTLRSVSASSGYFDILGLTAPTALGTVGAVGPEVAAELGLAPVSTIHMSDGTDAVVTRGTEDVRAQERSRWITTLVPTLREAQQCWIEVDRANLPSLRAALSAIFWDAGQLRVETLRDGAVVDSALEAWHSRWTQWSWLIAAGLVILFGAVLLTPRRHEYALYRLLGMRPLDIWLMALTELVVFLTIGIGLATVALFAYVVRIPQEDIHTVSTLATVQLLLVTASTSLLAVVVGIAIGVGRTANVIRHRR